MFVCRNSISAARSKHFLSNFGLSLLKFRKLFQTLVLYMYISINNKKKCKTDFKKRNTLENILQPVIRSMLINN